MATLEDIHALRDNPVFMEAFQRWWDEDYSWEGLSSKAEGRSGQTLQECWRSERRDLIEFADRKWTFMHLPPFDRDGNINDAFFATATQDELNVETRKSLYAVNTDKSNARPAILSGAIFDMGCIDMVDLSVGLYRDCIFLGPVVLQQIQSSLFPECTFVGPVNMMGVKSDSQLDFSGSTFLDTLRMEVPAVRLTNISFSDCVFCGYTDFSNSMLVSDLINFSRTSFKKNISFKRASLLGDIDFSGARFRGELDFRVKQVSGVLQFSNVRFYQRADFSGLQTTTEFRNDGYCDFGGSVFLTIALFGGSNFGVNFFAKNCRFSSILDFQNVTLKKLLIFDNSKFRGPSRFINTSFGSDTCFRQCQFLSECDFSNRDLVVETEGPPISRITFGKLDSPKGAAFKSSVLFDNRKFAGRTTFNDVDFHGVVSAHNSKMHPDTSFAGSRFYNKLRRSRSRKRNQRDQVELVTLEQGFRSLKIAMETNKSRHDQFMFHALELQTRRQRESVDLSERFVSWVYGFVSKYGESISRPIWVFLGATTMWTIVYQTIGYLEFRKDGLGWPHWLETLRFTLLQFSRPFSIWSEAAISDGPVWVEAMKDSSWFLGLAAVATLQSVLGIAIVTLFLFSIRRRFQIS